MQENTRKFFELREKYSTFIYENYEYNNVDKTVSFFYEIVSKEETIRLVHKIKLDDKISLDLKNPLIQNAVFNLGIAESINYWKAVCSPLLIIKPARISEKQKKWWNKLFYLGLGEFRYINDLMDSIDMEDFVRFECQSELEYKPKTINTKGNLIPIGGGKDSVVTLEALVNLNDDNMCILIDPNIAAEKCVEISNVGQERVVRAYRVFDKKLFSLNSRGFLNGHIPYSAILGFISLLVSIYYNRKYIVLSNENSANEPTVLGTNINHQYSKSYDFEYDFAQYINNYITTSVNYFSFLRPWNEIKIMKAFSSMKKYHNAFVSCNKGLKKGIWCCNCAKCLFIYIIMSPFISSKHLELIFGENLYNKKDLLEIFKQLLGIGNVKPFDCVGTVEEVKYCLNKVVDEELQLGNELPFLLDWYNKNGLVKKNGDMQLFENNKPHNLPEEFYSYLEKLC